jgi:hypothetical protein
MCVCLLIVLFGATYQASSPPSDLAALEHIVRDKSALAAEWENAAGLQILLGISGIVLGGLITVLQPWGATTWCKVTAGLLGLATAVVTGVITKAPVSSTAYQKSALQVRAKISSLNDDISFLRLSTDQQSQTALRDEFKKTVKEISQIQLKLSGDDVELRSQNGAKAGALLLTHIDVVYAQSESKIPSWVTALPVNAADLYFRGSAESDGLSDAKTMSLQNALEECTRFLMSQAASSQVEAVREYAKTTTIVADTFFSYDTSSRKFRYYTLLRLDKTLARQEVIKALSASGTKEDSSECRAMRVNVEELATFQIGGKPFYVYLARQSQQIMRRIDKVTIVIPTPEAADAVITLAMVLNGKTDVSTNRPIRVRVEKKFIQEFIDKKEIATQTDIEDGQSYVVTLDNKQYRIQVETHFIKRFANFTICPV